MKNNEKKQITDIVNAFRLVNQDIRGCFEIMSDRLESNQNYSKKWKKNEDGNKNYTSLLDGDSWYYLNCYGLYDQRIIGFTFVISVDYNAKEDINYSDFIDQLDTDINKHTPMLCILGIYDPIDKQHIRLIDDDMWQYVDDILLFTDRWKNFDKDSIKYDILLDVENHSEDDSNRKENYAGWYKKAKIKILNITDISSKTKAQQIIDDLLELGEKIYS